MALGSHSFKGKKKSLVSSERSGGKDAEAICPDGIYPIVGLPRSLNSHLEKCLCIFLGISFVGATRETEGTRKGREVFLNQ